MSLFKQNLIEPPPCFIVEYILYLTVLTLYTDCWVTRPVPSVNWKCP